MTYNASDQLIGISDSLSGTPFLSFIYGRDNIGQLASDTPKSYGYDANNRIQTYTNSSTTTYSYDNADRLTSAAVSGGGNTSTQAYDIADQVQSVTLTNGVTQIAKTTYGFDANGNRTSAAVLGGATTLLGYDQANRLVSYGASANYKYNGDGLRVSKTVSGTPEAFTWDVAEGLPLTVVDGSTSYISGLGGLPLEQVVGTTVYYFHRDQLGGTRALTDGAGAAQQTYDYDPLGNTIAASGSVINPFGYSGQYTDVESGLYYLRARYYDPTCAQFIGVDPAVAQTRARYTYARNSPVNSADPSGLDAWTPLQDALIAVGRALPPSQRKTYVAGLSGAATFLGTFADGTANGVCLSGSGGVSPVQGMAEVCMMVTYDATGHFQGFGTTESAGGGAGVGGGWSVLLSFKRSNAKRIKDFEGPFVYTSGCIGADLAGGVAMESGASPDGIVNNAQVGVGVGQGAIAGVVGVNNTWTQTWFGK